MKLNIIGIEISEGVSKTSKQNYSIGTVHTMTELAPPMGDKDNVAKGFAGDKYACDVGLLRKIQHLSFPLVVECEVKSQIRFGERQQYISDLSPLEVVKKAA